MTTFITPAIGPVPAIAVQHEEETPMTCEQRRAIEYGIDPAPSVTVESHEPSTTGWSPLAQWEEARRLSGATADHDAVGNPYEGAIVNPDANLSCDRHKDTRDMSNPLNHPDPTCWNAYTIKRDARS